MKGQEHEYHYTPSEHAAAVLALRDARKRYSIDSDRVFAAGQLIGANMAWDSRWPIPACSLAWS